MADAQIEHTVFNDHSDVDDYFSRSYLPLSNLPTPPMSAHSNEDGRENTANLVYDDDDSDLIGKLPFSSC